MLLIGRIYTSCLEFWNVAPTTMLACGSKIRILSILYRRLFSKCSILMMIWTPFTINFIQVYYIYLNFTLGMSPGTLNYYLVGLRSSSTLWEAVQSSFLFRPEPAFVQRSLWALNWHKGPEASMYNERTATIIDWKDADFICF